MAVSQSFLVRRIRQILSDYPFETTHSNAVAATTVTVPDGTLWSKGAVVEWDSDGGRALITAISGNDLTIRRDYQGATMAASYGANSVIYRDPDFPRIQIVDGVEGIIKSMWPYAWKTVVVTVTPSNTAEWFNISSAAMIDLVRVAQVPDGGLTDAIRYFGALEGRPVVYRNDHPTHGNAVRFSRGFFSLTNNVSVEGRAKLTAALSAGSYDDIEDDLMTEAVIYGTAARLVVAREIPRVISEDIRQGDTGVQPQARLTAGNYLQQHYERIRNQLAEDLIKRGKGPMRRWE